MRKLLAFLAFLLLPLAAYAAITGTVGTYQAQQMQIGQLALGRGTGTCVSNAVTINNGSGVITTEALSTAAGATQAITLTNSRIAAGDMVYAVADPNGSTGTPTISNVTVTATTAVFNLKNDHASAAFNGAIKIYIFISKQGNLN